MKLLSLISHFFQGKSIHSNDPSVVVRIDKDGVVQKLIPSDEGIQKVDLPQVLIMPGGIYTFENETYDCSIPGVYRFAKPQVGNAQRIVWDDAQEFNNLLFCSLLAVRGNADDRATLNKLSRDAQKRFLTLTCGPLSIFVNELAKDKGMKVRIVSTHTLQKSNSYNNGHTLLEYQSTQESSWVAYDVDKKCMFENQAGKILNVFEICKEIYSGNSITIRALANLPSLDLTQFVESSNGYNYQFLEAQVYGNPDGLLPLFNRICNVPYFSQPDGLYFGCWDKKSRDKIKTLYPSSRILEAEDFRQKFYE